MEDSVFSALSNLEDIIVEEKSNNKKKIKVNDRFFFKI